MLKKQTGAYCSHCAVAKAGLVIGQTLWVSAGITAPFVWFLFRRSSWTFLSSLFRDCLLFFFTFFLFPGISFPRPPFFLKPRGAFMGFAVNCLHFFFTPPFFCEKQKGKSKMRTKTRLFVCVCVLLGDLRSQHFSSRKFKYWMFPYFSAHAVHVFFSLLPCRP